MYDKDCLDVQKVVQKLLARISKRFSGSKALLIRDFVRLYYNNVAAEDILSRELSDLYDNVISHWELLYQRKPGECKIKIYNPESHKKDSHPKSTVIQLVADNMPFLVDSTQMEVNRHGWTNHWLINLGSMKVLRDKQGRITQVLPMRSTHESACPEAAIYMEIDRQADPEVLENLRINILRVLKDVKVAVEDWEAMRDRIRLASQELNEQLASKKICSEDIRETQSFLTWLEENFIFLGYREYQVRGTGEHCALHILSDTGLGVLRDGSTSKVAQYYADFPNAVRKLALSPQHILMIAKTNTDSTVHRRVRTDYIAIKRFDGSGHIIGERRFVGLFTSLAYNTDPLNIPILRNKVERVIERSGLSPGGYNEKRLLHILRTLPRDDLIQGTEDQIFNAAMAIMHFDERRRLRLLIRPDVYNRFISCLVYVPRDTFNTELRMKMQAVLMSAFKGVSCNFTPYFPESSILVRVHYEIYRDSTRSLKYDFKAIESQLIKVWRSWKDDLRDILLDRFGEKSSNLLWNKYHKAFPAGYRETFSAKDAAIDIGYMEQLKEAHDLQMHFYRHDGHICFKLFRLGHTFPLSDVMPILENMGLRVVGENPYRIGLETGCEVWINQFNMLYTSRDLCDVESLREAFQNAFYQIWHGKAENDTFNRLVLQAGLRWRQIVVLRAYAKYLRQIGFPLSQPYIEKVLNNNPDLTKQLMRLFELRFDPSLSRKSADRQFKAVKNNFYETLDCMVTSLDEDRVLRHYLKLIEATIRTNYFQQLPDKSFKDYLVFKLESRCVPEIPLPIPKYESFVYSTRMEGVHLRNGHIVRGGIRWSDRREDFRTEVLGLVKTQSLKNAVILPGGAKGCMVTKRVHTDRQAMLQEGVECYKEFIRGLLDITDNRDGETIIKPKQVVCHDQDDPYLVVAADKGTATFSDIANGIALEYQYWLKDAFASGGSHGYDHKKMGITARGAWESVKRHFYESAIDINHKDFTVVGVGDMGGDVFGNGMLLSRRIKLVAAFNHMHIFLDPNPNPQKSYEERLRLFKMARSTWADYNKKFVSKGGGIYLRSAKSISISPEVKRLLDIKQSSLTPGELIQAILKAPVDLLWNGGIGTYVKASHEEHREVGDWTNDYVRVDADKLRCRVVSEGGNLGMTQLARVEYALKGGRINTDAIDNSGGVDCSDHEVNIKILLDHVVQQKKLTLEKRNKLLSDMQETVTDLVLLNNYRQNLILSIDAKRQTIYFNLYNRYLKEAETKGVIDRAIECLPDEQALLERKAHLNMGLSRPELSVVMSYAKIMLRDEVLASDLPEDPYIIAQYLGKEFPDILSKKYASAKLQHPLRRDLVAMQLSNDLINDMGIVFVYQMRDELRVPVSFIVQAYVIVSKVFGSDALWDAIMAMQSSISAELQIKLLESVMRVVRRSTRWFLRNHRDNLDIATMIKRFAPKVKQLRGFFPMLLKESERKQFVAEQQALMKAGVPKHCVEDMASLPMMQTFLNIIETACESASSLKLTALIYTHISHCLKLDWLMNQVDCFPVDTHWRMLARSVFKNELDRYQRLITQRVLKIGPKTMSSSDRMSLWGREYALVIEQWDKMLEELNTYSKIDFPMLMVAIHLLYELTCEKKQAPKKL